MRVDVKRESMLIEFGHKQGIFLDIVLFGKDNVPFGNMGYAACPK